MTASRRVHPVIDLNADLGEDAARLAIDLELMSIVTSANIACAGHAGDDESMGVMVAAAVERGVHIGAHPSYPDRANFGRVLMSMGASSLTESVRGQVESLSRIARDGSARVSHTKPHGALYHAAMTDGSVAAAIGNAVAGLDLRLVGQAGCPGVRVWRDMGLRVVEEAFADRRYEADGSLRAREKAGALIDRPEEAAEQAVRIALGQGAIAEDGTVVAVRAETICVHSDTPGSVAIARAVRAALEVAGVVVRPMG